MGRALGENGDWAPAEENVDIWIEETGNNWAEFTAVPEPNMSLLAAAALATLGVVRRRRRTASEGTA